MKKNILLLSLFVFLVNIALAQDTTKIESSKDNVWFASDARTLKPKRIESGLFAPTRIGMKNNMEFSIHPIMFFIMPNARLKKNWTINPNSKLQVASEHGFTFPTLLLNAFARSGTGGVLPSTQKAPPILTLKNRVVMSYFYHKNHAISLRAGIEFNALQSMYTDFPQIELLLVYPRTATYHNFYTGEISMAFSGTIANKLGYDGDIKLFLIPDNKLTWVFEWNPKVYYHFSDKFRIMAGAIVSTGNIPHEKAAVRALPVLDLQFSFLRQKKAKRTKKTFK